MFSLIRYLLNQVAYVSTSKSHLKSICVVEAHVENVIKHLKRSGDL